MNIIKVTLTMTLIISISACGGGGGGSGANDNAAVVTQSSTAVSATANSNSSSSIASSSAGSSAIYSPDPALKESVASNSTQLYVEENFTFSDSAIYRVRISAKDSFSQPLANTAIHFYSASLDESTGEAVYIKGSLEFTAYTDNFGEFYREIEFPKTHEQLIVTLDTVGIESEKQVSLNTSDIVIHFD